MNRSPLAPERFPTLPDIPGLRLGSVAAGLRYRDRADLMLATVAEGASAAGVFTQSRCPAAPVEWSREVLASSAPRAVVCNAGNANAFTGRHGATAARATAEALAPHLGLGADEVLLASTGVIGESLGVEALTGALRGLVDSLGEPTPERWERAADAIRTTDTFAKGAAATVGGVTVAGIAKGSGMIAPDMATMLAFVFTDVAVDRHVLQSLVAGSAQRSFNRITVDSDTSTSDSLLAFATGRGHAPAITTLDAADDLGAALDRVTLDLAHQIVRDGEGATKFVEVRVRGAQNDASARTIALSIANSPLVKTAVAASDANWGRIVMAVGKAGEPADRDRLGIWIGDEQCAASGVKHPDYDEERATAHLAGHEVRLVADLGLGDGDATVWTCDLTHGYIEINAGYRS